MGLTTKLSKKNNLILLSIVYALSFRGLLIVVNALNDSYFHMTTSWGTYIVLGIGPILYVYTSFKRYKKIKIDSIILLYFFIFCSGLTVLFNSNASALMAETVIMFLYFAYFPYYLIRMENNAENILRAVYFFAIINLVYMLQPYTKIFDFNEGTRMVFSYQLVLSGIILYSVKRMGVLRKKIWTLLIVFIFFTVVCLGSRGVIMVLVGYFVIHLLFSYQIKIKTKLIYASMLIVVGFFIYNLIGNQSLIYSINDLVSNSIGINSRTLLMIQGDTMYGKIYSDSGRTAIIWSILDGLQGYRFLTGYGVNGDVINYGTYAHNVFAQLISNFGYIVGSLLIIGIIYACIKTIAITRNAKGDNNLIIYRELFIVFFAFSMIQLQFSSTIYTSMEFFIMLAICAHCNDYQKMLRKKDISRSVSTY